MVHILANALVPIFAGLLLGYLAGLLHIIDNQNVGTLITFVMNFAIPCALFLAVASTPRSALRQQAPAALVLVIAFVVLYAASFAWARSKEYLPPSDSSVVALTFGFPNSAAVGLPLLTSVFGPSSTVTVATALALGAITVSPVTLAILEASRSRSGFSLRRIGISLIRSFGKPVVWAPLMGLLFSVAGLDLPSFASRTFAMMASASDGSALVLTGLVVSAQKFEIHGNTFISVFMKNILQPVLALGLAMLIHLPISQMRYVTLISAMPCGFFGMVFGKGFDSSPTLASSGLVTSYATGIGTLAAWTVIVNHLA